MKKKTVSIKAIAKIIFFFISFDQTEAKTNIFKKVDPKHGAVRWVLLFNNIKLKRIKSIVIHFAVQN